MNITNEIQTRLPLLQAPLTAYPNQSNFVAEVSNQGALGIYSSDFQQLEKIKNNIQAIKAKTHAPFAVVINLSESDAEIDLADQSSTNTYLKSAYQALGIEGESSVFPSVNDICKTVVTEKPPVVIFQNGLPTNEFIEHCHKTGIAMLGMASNTLEVIAIDESQINGIILQGNESAGPQSQFENDLPTQTYAASTLLHHAKQVTNKPLFIWGNPQTVTNGVTGVILDTPFWTTAESPIPNSFRQALTEHNEMLVVSTSIWQGQPANAIQNTLTAKQKYKKQVLATSKQKRLMAPIIHAAIEQDNADYLPLWAGHCANISEGSIAELCKTFNNKA